MMADSRIAVLTMEVEDWYHLDYFSRERCDQSQRRLDGLDRYLGFLSEHGLPSSLFVIGEIASQVRPQLLQAARQGHDLACHGWSHRRPSRMSVTEFRADLQRASDALGNLTGEKPIGYRAPCFDLDRERLDVVHEAGFLYDSSCIASGRSSGGSAIDRSDFRMIGPGIYGSADLYEFEVGTLRVAGRGLPVSSAGYLRQLPWWLMSRLVRRYLESGAPYILYVHPFELSDQPAPNLPADTKAHVRLRFSLGRYKLARRLGQVIQMLKQHGYIFTTFRSLREQLVALAPAASCATR